MASRRLMLALNRSIKALPREAEDEAMIELTRMYARQLDSNELGLLNVLGRGFRESLEALGMTPRARAALMKKAKEPETMSPIDELRARRQNRETS